MIIQRAPLSSALPFDLDAVATHCRAEDPAFFLELARMATTAALELEDFAQLALIEQTIIVTLPRGPRRMIFDLPVIPLADTASVEVVADGAPFEDFTVITGKWPAIRFTTWPRCSVVITYRAGFGTSLTDIPQDIANAICDQTAVLFDMRGGGDGKAPTMSPHMARVAARWRKVAL